MVFKNIILLVTLSITMSGCALWPYQKDFDCPITEGLKCKSLYDISVMADKGLFGPNAPLPKCEELDTKKSKKQIKTKNKQVGRCTNG